MTTGIPHRLAASLGCGVGEMQNRERAGLAEQE